MAFEAVSGHGCHVYDSEGERWLDMRAGIMTASLGHGSPIVESAIDRALESGLINSYSNKSTAARSLEKLLHDFQPGYDWHLLNTGSEAVDRAIQLVSARINRRPKIAVIRGGFHGKMMHQAPARYVCPWGNPLDLIMVDPSLEGAPSFDALLYEPVQGLTGLVLDEKELRAECQTRGAYMIADEMVTGFYRCGKPFISKNADIIVGGKGLGQGAPLAVLGASKEFRHFELPVGWTTTATANNLCASIGLAVLTYLMTYEDEIRQDCARIEKTLTDLDCRATGALGFYYPSCSSKRLRWALEKHRVLATVMDNIGPLRLGPPFKIGGSHFKQLQDAIREAEQ